MVYTTKLQLTMRKIVGRGGGCVNSAENLFYKSKITTKSVYKIKTRNDRVIIAGFVGGVGEI